MNNSYIEETLKFIESAEMCDYLRANANLLDGRDCAETVAYAPAPIERKIPVLDLIAEQSGCKKRGYNLAKSMARAARTALAERYDNPIGTVFRLRQWLYHEEISYLETAFFTEFDAAIRHLEKIREEYSDADDINQLSHSIAKIIPGENGAMKVYCEWVLNYSGEIWYFGINGGQRKILEKWDDIWDYWGCNLNLPVPFKPGDIVLADCRPFAKERRILITDVGDNRNCCAVRCMYILPGGKLEICAFKHNSFFVDTEEYSHISGLYRAARWQGKLAKNEAPLAIVGEALKANPQIGAELEDFFRTSKAKHGVPWKQVKEAFGF
jgi:hypothetical protein